MTSNHGPNDRESILAWQAWWALEELAGFIWNRYQDAFANYCLDEANKPDDFDEFLDDSDEGDEIPF